MGFWSSLHYFRPGPAPVVTTAALAEFVARVGALPLFDAPPEPRVKVRFGTAVDADMQRICWEEPVVGPDGRAHEGLTAIREMEWDLQLEGVPLAEAVAALGSCESGGQPQRVYRASISFGTIAERLWIVREPCEENGEWLCIGSLGLTVEPVLLADPASDGPTWHVGWMALAFSGQGYAFPWTHDDVIAMVKARAPLRDAAAICRELWPVPQVAPTPELVEQLKEMGHDLWGDADFAAPLDWHWAVDWTF